MLRLSGTDEPDGFDAFFRTPEFYDFVQTCPDDRDLKPDAYVRLLKLVSTQFPDIADALNESSGFDERMATVASAPLTEEKALEKLDAAGDAKSRLDLLLSPAMRACVALDQPTSAIKALLAMFPSLGRIRTGIESDWPASKVRTLILSDLPEEVDVAIDDGSGPVSDELMSAMDDFKKMVDKSVPEDDRPAIQRAIDEVISGLERSNPNSERLRAARKSLGEKIDGLSLRALQKRMLATPLQQNADEFEQVIATLDG